jgi:hypothetical protein
VKCLGSLDPTHALALGLSLVLSEVYIPRKKKVLVCAVFVLDRACSLARAHQPHLWCDCHRVLEGTSPAAVGSLIVKTTGSGPGDAFWRPTSAWGRPGAIHSVT